MTKMVQMRSIVNNLYERFNELKAMETCDEDEMYNVIEMIATLLPRLSKLESQYDIEPSIDKLGL